MKNILLVGGGKIGIAITELLGATGDYRVTVADRDAASLARMPGTNVKTRKVETSSRPNSCTRWRGTTSSSPRRPTI